MRIPPSDFTIFLCCQWFPKWPKISPNSFCFLRLFAERLSAYAAKSYENNLQNFIGKKFFLSNMALWALIFFIVQGFLKLAEIRGKIFIENGWKNSLKIDSTNFYDFFVSTKFYSLEFFQGFSKQVKILFSEHRWENISNVEQTST